MNNRSLVRYALLVPFLLAAPEVALGQEAEAVSQELFTVNNTWMLVATFLVFIMHLGFACLESGLTQAKNAVNILFKNTSIIAIGLLTYAVIGFNLMYPGDFSLGGFFGFAGFGLDPGPEGNTIAYADGAYTYWTDFHFSGDVRGHGRDDRVGGGRRAYQAELVPHLHDDLCRDRLSPCRIVEVGRRLARWNGLLRFRRLDTRALGRWVGGSRWHHRARSQDGQIRRPGRSGRSLDTTCRWPRSAFFFYGSDGSGSTEGLCSAPIPSLSRRSS